MSDYLRLAEIMAIHDDQLRRYGGKTGVRDQGLLEAALARPQSGYYASIIEEAAALWESLSQNHPFLDGNKRTAFAATWTFLVINQRRLMADAAQTEAFLLNLYATASMKFDRLDPWLGQHNAEIISH